MNGYKVERITGGKNKIYFGASGVGKNKYIHDKYKDNYNINLVLHSEYKYEDFIGHIKEINTPNGSINKLTPGAFTEILIKALDDPYNMYNLTIKNLNKENFLLTFGDLVKLMKRKEDGSSKHKIKNNYIYEYIKNNIKNPSAYNDEYIYIYLVT